jgi:DNA ligase 1
MTMTFKPTLAATLPVNANLEDLPYPLWVSPKYDGMRALVQGGKLVSRNGILIPNHSACAPIEALDLEGFDGELVVGKPTAPDVRNRTMSYLSTRDWKDKPEPLTYFVFDCCQAQPFEWRQSSIRPGGVTSINVLDKYTKIVIVKQTMIRTAAALAAYEARMVALGHEGVMLRRCDGASDYMQKRSTLKEFELVKFKRWEHSEADIVAVHSLEHNQNTEETAAGRKSSKKAGMVVDAALMGSVTLRDVKSKREFNVQVPGAALQASPFWHTYGPGEWLGAKIRVTYKFQPGAKGVPIHPTCAFAELGVK